MDIDMAMERHLARRFLDSNSYIVLQYSTTGKGQAIPRLLSSQYIIGTSVLMISLIKNSPFAAGCLASA